MSGFSASSPLLSMRNLFLFASWSLALFGTLQMHRWEGLFGHAICGPWGCGPPVSALIGYHGFWLQLLLLPAWLLKHRLQSPTLHRLASAIMLIATVGIVTLLAIDGWETWQREAMRPYIVQRIFFRLATFVDFPLVQLGLISLWLRNGRRLKSRSDETGASDQEHD